MFLFFLDHDCSDEGIPLTGNEESGSKSSSDHSRFPTHVYKEYLPSTINRTGEARSIHVYQKSYRKTNKSFFAIFL